MVLKNKNYFYNQDNILFFRGSSSYVAQVGPELLNSSDPPASAS
jgi:hypothetical protein